MGGGGGGADPNTTKSGPLSKLHLNGVSLADDGPTLNAGLTQLLFSGDPDQYC